MSESNLFKEIREEINPSIGQLSPEIKPKLDDTIPSILNLSGGNSKKKETSKNDSFNLDNLKIKKKLFQTNKVFSLFNNKNKNFNSSHYKAFSNENFSISKILINSEDNEENEKINEDEYDESMYFQCIGKELNFEEKNSNNEEESQKNIFVDNFDENINNTEDEEENDGLFILNMLRKIKEKK